MFKEENEYIFVSEQEAGQRLDVLLTKRFAGVQSRTYFQSLIEQQHVLVNGVAAKKRILPKAGDEIEIHFICSPELTLEAEPIPLEILYEDEYLLAVNKPAGMVVHPAVGNWTGTFVNALLYHCKKLDLTGTLRPGIVHRLDKDTSGVLLAAKTTVAQQRLVEAFASRMVKKQYWAICVGNPGEGECLEPLGRHPINRQMMAVRQEGGKSAHTIYRTLAKDAQFSLVELYPHTGRTHQLRVHMKHLGTPVLGDSVYGFSHTNSKYGCLRQLLHARCLSLVHPMTGKSLNLEAHLPLDVASWADKLTKF